MEKPKTMQGYCDHNCCYFNYTKDLCATCSWLNKEISYYDGLYLIKFVIPW